MPSFDVPLTGRALLLGVVVLLTLIVAAYSVMGLLTVVVFFALAGLVAYVLYIIGRRINDRLIRGSRGEH